MGIYERLDIKNMHEKITNRLHEKKIGSITINFFKGGISNIELKESRKLKNDKSK